MKLIILTILIFVSGCSNSNSRFDSSWEVSGEIKAEYQKQN